MLSALMIQEPKTLELCRFSSLANVTLSTMSHGNGVQPQS